MNINNLIPFIISIVLSLQTITSHSAENVAALNNSNQNISDLSTRLTIIEKTQQLETNASKREIENTLRYVDRQATSTIEMAKQLHNETKDWVKSYETTLAYLTTFFGLLMAVAGIGLPVLFTSKQRTEYDARMQEVRDIKISAENILSNIKEIYKKSDESYKNIKENEDIFNSRKLGEKATDAEKAATRSLANESDLPISERLRALGYKALDEEEWHDAINYFQALCTYNPHNEHAWFSLGYSYYREALSTTGEKRASLLETAIAKYSEAIALDSKYDLAYNNWGAALSALAQEEANDKQYALHQEAIEKYTKAIDINPNYYMPYDNWGLILLDMAGTKKGTKRRTLLLEAIEKFTTASHLAPEDQKTYAHWGKALLELSRNEAGEEQLSTIRLAEEKFLKSESIEPGKGAYNLACVYALTNQEIKCREWLKISHDHGNLPECKHIEKDTDLDSVREHEWFKEFIARIC